MATAGIAFGLASGRSVAVAAAPTGPVVFARVAGAIRELRKRRLLARLTQPTQQHGFAFLPDRCWRERGAEPG
ncbi:hypothetical protein HPB52_011296 [Rhipicephalus sanguineus]|uniref:Uncharacterized protein n=1 Tax=Rhipicephalus sanguineus TaxID=34632 RepID=A0A9D4Q695_RHISA|nr:hypothetical protein HPB52_011296 [Rhipicephalus sanguineus]